MLDRMLILLPFWDGDKAQMGKLARLLTDLEPTKTQLADILFISRFDAKHDPALVKYVSKRFNVFTHRSMRQGTGWPMGCNGLWFGTIEWCYHMIAAKKAPAYRALINMEADCIPLRRDWLAEIRRQWISVSKDRPVAMAGDIINVGGRDHINANAVISGDLRFLKWMATIAGGHEKRAGWDWYLAGDICRWGWARLPGIKSRWNTPTFTDADWIREVSEGTTLFHGVKDESLLDMARKKLL